MQSEVNVIAQFLVELAQTNKERGACDVRVGMESSIQISSQFSTRDRSLWGFGFRTLSPYSFRGNEY